MKEKHLNTSERIFSKLRGDKAIWSIVFLLTIFSLLIVYSSSSSLAFRRNVSNFSIFLNQLKFVALGWAALYVCYKIPIRWYRIFSIPLFVVTIGLLGYTLIGGREVNGAIRGIGIGGFTFQPSELAKVTLVLYLARIIELDNLQTFGKFLLKIAAPVGAMCALVAWGSISMALLLGIIFLAILFATGIKASYIFKTIGIGLCAIVFIMILHFSFGAFPRLKTAMQRIERFTKDDDKESTKELTKEELQAIADENLQEDMARIAVVSGKLIGKGPGKSTQRFILPHPYSDFVYSLVIEEYGLLVAILIMLVYISILYNCVKLARQCKAVFSSVTVTGIGFGITFQAFLHILVNVGILPITGHTLPIISLGGSSLLIVMGSIGIVLSVSRSKEAIIERAKQQKLEEKMAKQQVSDSEKEAYVRAMEEDDYQEEYNDENKTKKDIEDREYGNDHIERNDEYSAELIDNEEEIDGTTAADILKQIGEKFKGK